MASGRMDLAEPLDVAPPRGGAIADKLRGAILDGKYGPGARLNEVHLSRDFGVSRTPVRGALQTLVGEALLEYTPNKGYSVRAFAVSEIVDAFEMRALAEGLAARLAAERGLTPANEADLSASLAELDGAITFAASAAPAEAVRNPYSAANERFHTAIHRAADSRLVTDVIALCSRVPLTLTRHIIDFKTEDLKDRVEEHHQIYDAILSRQPREAERLMYEHDQVVRRALVRVLAKSGS
ncbi:MAG: GntR family transcriptional regulator [Rhodospirillaceae bacterium]|nr:GntR family transcriptional regulator [Rhodospirillaceae bacterium]MBT3926473.1 GntR family transcriptional regulator [Rhodospirillaceae bacterium]MBT4426329.1 GntR family transcriptional regulator [Rhodospirillaceae bacterium]MBT5039675.1 GntR family transcriptional regulator [Rhodospirillaceae bacterium]MBT5674085.1 GntR family transcriptional regulator [Rhodospirillaceae bacterium]